MMTLKRISFTKEDTREYDFRNTIFDHCALNYVKLADCKFGKAELCSIDLTCANLRNTYRFKSTLIFKVQATKLLRHPNLKNF